MESEEAITVLSALGQATRLEAFRLLVAKEPDGMAAGGLAELLDVPQNTLSAHFNVLMRAKLVKRERRSRQIVYRANLERFREIAQFLVEECCGGRPELCGWLIAAPDRRKPARAKARLGRAC